MPEKFRAKRLRESAEESRTMAETLANPKAKQTMLQIAADYEKMAARAEFVAKAVAPIRGKPSASE
jgi:hypothetical protein